MHAECVTHELTLNVMKISGASVMSSSFPTNETVAVVKKAIHKATGTPEADQKLLWESQELVDNVTLEEYHFAESSDVTLVINMHPLARWARVLQDSTGKDFRSQLKRRDAVCKLKQIIADRHVQHDPEAVKCLLTAFERQVIAGNSVESVSMYFEALKLAAKGTGNADAVEFLMRQTSRYHLRESAVDALCEVVGTSSPPAVVVEHLEHLPNSHRARKFLNELKRSTQQSYL